MLFVIGYFDEPSLLLLGCAFLQAIRHAERNDALGNEANALNLCQFVNLHAKHFRSCKRQIDEPELA